ncbi:MULTISPECIES: flagellin N-terminal helical domain-containing protein [Chromobacterium]|uniref:Flagellin n=3 Tax=Chromobacterium TaxID=535 RepID=A0ABS3GPX5_9NEIS|nr:MULTISPECIES: flagellin [Chromobacterium]AXT47994.1 flagellin FliC [Chromobacterium rhizoryzae]MBK0415042.1 flagellin FliC [Chromobacterium haemolyticum]MBO0416288.1 flagellin FliC [Chromobacterium haemolyticum]MBO0499680.1 flagellin FliC [Chromobacterium haemolyticum]MDH0342382.1 flagellin [Chromobacterium haemolyticum]
MAITVNTNIASLNAQRNLGSSNNSLQVSLQRLSSGLRVNSAKDDAAGLAISQTLTSAIRGNNQAIKNANDGISVGQTAEGALGQLANNMQRIREIAVQASNGSVSNTNRSQLQSEVDQLTQEISRIVQTTQFNGTSLLSGGSVLTFQVGSSGAATNQVSISSTDLTSAGTLNTYSSSLSNTGTINVTTQGAASAALSALDTDIAQISNIRSTFGAVQNRFDAVVNNLQNYTENLTAANSRIIDVDFAAETANLTKNQILQQAGTSILKNANSLPQSALTLLQ